mmetsp:Transcript_13517/g.30802  ORF Transcript_13517/g.30802 Transcript_13517/m.30802 type:complete len:147 (+) Transcript_13517:86-526(+)
MKVITCACCLLLWIDTSTLAINEGLIKRNLRQLRDDEAESLLLLETAFFDSSMSLAMSKDEPSNGGPNSKSNKTPKSKSSKASIDLTKDLEYAQGYNPDKPSTYSPGAIQLSTLRPHDYWCAIRPAEDPSPTRLGEGENRPRVLQR